jgi:hypothetical protein
MLTSALGVKKLRVSGPSIARDNKVTCCIFCHASSGLACPIGLAAIPPPFGFPLRVTF